MFDFSPVGLVCALAGIAFVTLVGWRLLPDREGAGRKKEAEEGEAFLAEAKVPEDSKAIGKTPRQLYELADEQDVAILGLVRRGKRLPGLAASETIRKGDVLILEGETKSIEAFIGAARLDVAGTEKHGGITGTSLSLVEATVPEHARMSGRSANDLRLLYRHGVVLLGVSRQGQRFRQRVRELTLRPGDLVLLLGPESRIASAAEWLGVLPLEDRRHAVLQRQKAALAIAVFAAAIGAAVGGFVSLPIGLAAAVAVYAGFGIVGPREVYEAIEWPVIVLLGSLIPIGIALEQAGGTTLIAEAILELAAEAPVWVVLAAIMVVTMTLSDFLNNVATALIAAPVSIDVATALGVSPDPFLMAVAVAASCAFLTPIGHQNNTIIMGPGGYSFGDYWRMGLPLEIIIVTVGVPSILFFWPL